MVGLALGDEVLVQRTVDVPTQAELLDETATLDADVPAGTPICFHVNNHGTNSWNLFDVSLAERPEPRCGEDSAP